MKFMRSFLLALLALVAIISLASAAAPEVDEKECEVCTGVLGKFQSIVDEKKLKDVEKIEDMFREECKSFTHPKEKRLCWYLGASKDSATNILRQVSRPLTVHMPPMAICRKLRKIDSSICSLRYTGSSVQDPIEEPKPSKPKVTKPKVSKIDFTKVPSMRVKELKAILQSWDESCTGCAEKGDFVSKIMSLRSKYEGKTEL